MEATNGINARLSRAERDIERLVDRKADLDDIISLRREVGEVKKILLWFMGIAATAMLSGFGVVLGILVTH